MKLQQHGFSLKEILIVIAIIGVMTAILFPVFASAGYKSKGVSCLSHHRQLAVGIMMYVQDYDEKYPMTVNFSAPQKTLWTEMIWPYVKEEVAFRCSETPLDSFLKRSNPAVFYADSWKNRSRASIGMNAQFLFDKTGKAGFKKVFSSDKLEIPSEVIMLADTFNSPIKNRPAYEGGYMFDSCSSQGKKEMPPIVIKSEASKPIATNNPSNAIITRHSSFCTVSFADGHTKMLRIDISNQYSAWRFRGCNFDKEEKSEVDEVER
jgi:prepilin-type N-terminal cleavage/methylation domain-containing protein/prepilin-type processing-associated H-X9-DG protein